MATRTVRHDRRLSTGILMGAMFILGVLFASGIDSDRGAADTSSNTQVVSEP